MNSQLSLDCFKAYDIRGRMPDQLNPEIAERIGRAFADFIAPESVVVGYDIRESSPELPPPWPGASGGRA